jgi:LPS-assembly lipoprotein
MFKTTRILIIIAASLICGCGFGLRQSIRLPTGVSSIQLSGLDALNPLIIELERSLRASNVLQDQSSESTAELVVLSESVNREVLSVNDNARVSEFVLVGRASAKLVNQGTEIVPAFEVVTRREYSFDEAQALGAAQEEDIIRVELRKELAQLILLRVGRR